MNDPFLLAHRVLRSFFLISYRVSPISIRDQMVRGLMIIDRLLENRLSRSQIGIMKPSGEPVAASIQSHNALSEGQYWNDWCAYLAPVGPS